MTKPNEQLLQRIGDIRYRVEELENRFSSGELGDSTAIRALGLELAKNKRILRLGDVYVQAAEELESTSSLLEDDDPEMVQMARDEIPEIEARLDTAEQKLIRHLRPDDPHEGAAVFLEIRAGTGGDEAALFAADMYRMYCNYAASRGWKVTELGRNETGLNGFKEVIAKLEGDEVWSDLKFETGVHRVQRIPKTESGGRIHTSACTVALIPEIADSEINIRPEDVRIDVFRSSGAGGQHVNTTDSAVRITHIETGIVVNCQNERSQIKNRAAAMKVLAARLQEQQERESADVQSALRKGQVGSGDRSERIRTYNFPQNRVTDHRIGLTLYKLDAIIEGQMDEMVDALAAAEARSALGEVIDGTGVDN